MKRETIKIKGANSEHLVKRSFDNERRRCNWHEYRIISCRYEHTENAWVLVYEHSAN